MRNKITLKGKIKDFSNILTTVQVQKAFFEIIWLTTELRITVAIDVLDLKKKKKIPTAKNTFFVTDRSNKHS